MSDLVEFLRARLDEDEAVAREAASATCPDWKTSLRPMHHGGSAGRIEVSVPGRREWLFGNEVEAATVEHIARHDPARVLADVEAKRRIIAECVGVTRSLDILLGDCVLALLALPYAEHPDYQQEWTLSDK